MKLGMRLLTLTVLLAAPLAAQQPADSGAPHPHGRGGMMEPGGMMMMRGRMGGPGGGPMMGGAGMAYSPARLLALNGELSLTAQQITALTALRDAAKKSRDGAMDKIKTHMDELRTALDAATPDTTAIRTHFLAAHDAMGQAHLAMLITNARAKALLTDAQRGMLESRRRGGGFRMRSF